MKQRTTRRLVWTALACIVLAVLGGSVLALKEDKGIDIFELTMLSFPIVGALVAAYYFAMRPVTLRIAVGPANSDDLKVVQNLTQALNNQRNSVVRLRPVQTDGALASANLLGEGKADFAIIS